MDLARLWRASDVLVTTDLSSYFLRNFSSGICPRQALSGGGLLSLSQFLEHIQLHPSYHYHPPKLELHWRTQYRLSEHVTLQNILQIFLLKNILTSFVASISIFQKFSRETPNFQGGFTPKSLKAKKGVKSSVIYI